MRIIAGRLGGRRINAPEGLETRPTSDRVREALFSRLGHITGAKVLDLYAGTSAQRFLKALGPFDLVFLDPPYALLPEVAPIVAALLKADALSPDARVIVEHSSKNPAPPLPGFEAADPRRYGTTTVSVYRRAEG